ncbi:MAG: hypothetical protein MJ105_06180 [Lachnospiraceae bacterium]|nr:hypothetical protein [Lachnospiraceae bacterium]
MKFQLRMQDEYAKGHASGLAEGHAKINSILLGLMQTTNCSAKEALKMCNVPEHEWETYLDLLNTKEQ